MDTKLFISNIINTEKKYHLILGKKERNIE